MAATDSRRDTNLNVTSIVQCQQHHTEGVKWPLNKQWAMFIFYIQSMVVPEMVSYYYDV